MTAATPTPSPEPRALPALVPSRRAGRAWRKMRGWVIFLIVAGVLAASGYKLYKIRQASAAVEFPVAPARKGDFLAIVRCRGDLKAGRTAPVYVPTVPNLRISWMAPSGDPVNARERNRLWIDWVKRHIGQASVVP